MSRIAGSIFVLAMVLTVAHPVASGRDYTFRVSVEVASDTHKTQITSYLNRTLRNMSDVEIAYSNPRRMIHIVHIARRNERRHEMAVAYSQSFGLPPSWETVPVSTDIESATKYVTYIHNETGGFFKDLFLVSGPDINALCNDIVATVDVRHFESDRKTHAEMLRR